MDLGLEVIQIFSASGANHSCYGGFRMKLPESSQITHYFDSKLLSFTTYAIYSKKDDIFQVWKLRWIIFSKVSDMCGGQKSG